MSHLFRQDKALKRLFPAAVYALVILLFQIPSLAEAQEIEIKYYGETGCSHCDDFTSKTVPELENRFRVDINVSVTDILSASGYEECREVLEKKGYSFKYFPVVIIGNNIYQGATEISGNLAEEVKFFAQNLNYMPERDRRSCSGNEGNDIALNSIGNIRITALLAAGLADGINPCAFTVLLFFFSYLSLRQKSYSRFLAAGAVFIFAVFTTYLFIGFGLYSMLGVLTRHIQAAGKIIRVGAVSAALIFAVLSVRDYIEAKKIKKDGSGRIFLKLPVSVQNKIHKVIRTNLGAGSMLLLVFAAGFIVSVLELACTGQVYLPAIAYILQKDSFRQGIFLLILYNTGFIFPMLIIYTLLALGVRLNPVMEFYKSKAAESRLLLAFVFGLLAMTVWIL